MSRLRIKDLPIAAKSLIAPLAGALITAGLAVCVVLTNTASIRSVGDAAGAETLATAVRSAQLHLTQGHTALLRAVTWRANGAEKQRIEGARRETEAAFARANDTLQDLKFPDSERAKAEELKKLVGQFRESAKQVLDVLFEDESVAVMLMNDTDELSNGLAAAVEQFAAGVSARSADLNASVVDGMRNDVKLTLGIAASGIVLALGLAWLPVRLISRPVKSLTVAVSRLAEGDLDTSISADDRSDEIGAMTRALIVLKQNSEEMRRLQGERKDAEARVAAQRKADMHQLAENFEMAVGAIVSTVSSAATELEASASTLSHTAGHTQELSTSVAAASEQASNNVQTVASATNELSASVSEIGRQVQESSKIADEAVKQAQKTDSRIAELSQAANRIGDVVKLITGVAEQTNLLALNATIEAARAGDAGKGFAVVAHEVKALAAQTAKATEEIGTQIAGMQAATQDSVAAIKEIGGTISRMSDIAAAIAATVKEQSAATQEISRNVQQAAQGTAEVAKNITDVNRGASETGSASGQVLSSAQSLSAEGNKLKTEVDRFLSTIRAS